MNAVETAVRNDRNLLPRRTLAPPAGLCKHSDGIACAADAPGLRIIVALTAEPPLFLIVAALLATLLLAAFVLFVVLRSIRREQRGFDINPPAEPSGERHDPPT